METPHAHGEWRTPDTPFQELPEVVDMITQFKTLLPVQTHEATLKCGKDLIEGGTVTLRVGEQNKLVTPPRIQGEFTLRGTSLFITLQAYALEEKKD